MHYGEGEYSLNIVFMGTPDFSVPILKRIIEDGYHVLAVVTQPDRPKGRKKVLTPPPVKVEALKHNLPVMQPEKLRNEYGQIINLKPDLIVTAAYGQMLPVELLEAPPFGCINVHASLLPEYRGGAPIHQAIIDGKKETGVTIMYMVKKMDAGDILQQVKVPIEEDDHVGTMHDKLSAAGAELLSKTIPLIEKGSIHPDKQEEDKVTFSPNIKREQELIDWTKDGEAIYNQIRGLHPWPVAFTYLDNKPLKIWWGEKVPLKKQDEPGKIVSVEENGFIVATGNLTGIKVVDLQPSGKKRMDAEQFLKGRKMTPGERLGMANE
ncbi:methionyl-tRNA formyltransferase [Pueribacillus theae]|uniref:Methionyl-tRNA formyltransferase n=1 Tax=Pueribacillus theae TaxID=2171751 RepID=A0A2U1K887_9BACI|nr:methionyl-tRNA formyltransferase [Pueribacillus theae]PWA13459.1 methionyl-tRNA formyltransferase [Pueribacillus theae]